MKKVEIYSTPSCMYCGAAKDFFKKNNITYTEYNVATDQAKRSEMLEKSGQLGVPVIDVAGDIVVGYDEKLLRQLLEVK
ncbi:MAG: NrdH-redoxin [Patescibacteria group bacterium]|nr:NrdH-redoxin [Patescibacteria group bacterium]MDE2116348.1 NrdH-redoxin [Patescibacteria group bacterium]